MISPAPKPPPGKPHERKAWLWPYRAAQRSIIIHRAKHRCEAPGCPAWGEEWEHIFKRGNIVAEPLASHNAFGAYLCRRHHGECTDNRNVALQAELRYRALQRICAEFAPGLLAGMPMGDHGALIGLARRVEHNMKFNGSWDELVLYAEGFARG